MTQRLDIVHTNPVGVAAVSRLDAYGAAHLPARLHGLVQLRASQLNGCRYCIALHTGQLREAGETEARIAALAAPALDAAMFDAQEVAALRLTDAVTRLESGGVPDDVWAAAERQFAPAELGDLIVGIATINAWNRIGIATRMEPEE